MATLYLKTAGGNWTDANAWSNVNSAGVDNSGPPTAADDCIAELASGQLTISAVSVGKSFSAIGGTGSWAGTLTHNAFTLTLSGNCTFSSGMTYVPLSTSTLAFNAIATIVTAGKLLSNLQEGTGTLTLGDNIGFIASTVIVFLLTKPTVSLDMNGKSISGNSSINRVRVGSSVVGSACQIINATNSFSNCDFRDIQFSSAVNLDLSAITGLSGDCGGNSITGGGTTLTFTPSAIQTWSGTVSGNWSTNAWSGRVPLPQDDVSFNVAFSASQTVANDMPRMGRSIDWTGATGSPTWTLGTSNQTLYGSMTLISNMTFNLTQTTIFEGRGSFSLKTAGNTIGSGTGSLITVQMIGGTLNFQDTYTSTGVLTLNNGTINTNNFNINVFAISSSVTNTRALNISNSQITLTQTSGNAWNIATSSGITLISNNSIIIISDTSVSSKTFAGGGLTYNNLQITGGGSGAIIITGANTFTQIKVVNGSKSITLPGSTTTTILSGNDLGNGTNVVTFTSSAGSATISKASGILSWNYVNLTNIPSTGGATFYAGANSTDGGGNTGWNFSNAPAISGGFGKGRFGGNKFGIKKFGIVKFSI